MKKSLFLALALTIPAIAAAQDAPPAKEMACRACHGVGGAAPLAPNYPKLNGQNKEYLVSALQAYKAGQRSGGLAVVMTGQAAMLSEAEMQELAAYYASQE